MTPLHGILPALVTPFDPYGRLSPKALEKLLTHVYAAGVHGVYVCGQAGEGLLQPLEQRKQVAEVAVRNSPSSKQVIVHIGAPVTPDAVELARHAGRIGATAVSSLPPAGSYSFGEIRAYYEAIACSAGVPVLVYYFPEGFPGVAHPDQLFELTSIPNVVGLKFTDYNLYAMSELRKGGKIIFNGRDEVLAAGLLMGADGGIGTLYNLVPELFLELYCMALTNQWQRAYAVQSRINELITIVLRFPVFPAIKQMLLWAGIDCGPCLLPRRELTPAEQQDLLAAIKKSGFAGAPFSDDTPGL